MPVVVNRLKRRRKNFKFRERGRFFRSWELLDNRVYLLLKPFRLFNVRGWFREKVFSLSFPEIFHEDEPFVIVFDLFDDLEPDAFESILDVFFDDLSGFVDLEGAEMGEVGCVEFLEIGCDEGADSVCESDGVRVGGKLVVQFSD